jgi:uroporphyrinogen-III decarboxylase
MTSRDRYLNSLRGGPVDRFFRYELGPWGTTMERWVAEGYPAGKALDDEFKMDPIARIHINSGYTNSPFHPGFERQVVEDTSAYLLYVDGDGILKKELREHADTSMPQFIRFPVTGRDDWALLRKRLNPADAAARIGDPARVRAQCARPDTPTFLPICGAYGLARNLLGEEGLAYLIYDDPAMFEDILDVWAELYVQLLRGLTKLVRVDSLLFWEDMCFKTGPLLGPEHVKKWMMPRYRKVIEAALGSGVGAIMVDTDGDCSKLIPLFLDAGVQALMPFEVQAGMDVVAIAKQYPQLGIMGGIDKRALAKDRDSIKKEVKRVVPFFLERGRFIPTLDHTVPPDVPLENFRYYLDCVRQYEPKPA